MEEEIGVRVTRSRRRLSVEKGNETNSPVGTPTKKKNTKVALKPHLDNIGENEVVASPTRATRRSIVPESNETAVTPSKRTIRVRSNTSLSSVVESPRALRVTRRNSLLAESELTNKATSPKPKTSRRTSQDLNSISQCENADSLPVNKGTSPKPKARRRISQDLISVSKDENSNSPKCSTMRSQENLLLPHTPSLIENNSVSNINDFIAQSEVSPNPIEEEILKTSPQKSIQVKNIDKDLTNIDKLAADSIEKNIDTDIDKTTVTEEPSKSSPTILRKSPRLKTKSDSTSSGEFTSRRSSSKNMSFEQSDNNLSAAKELSNISPSNKENESLSSAKKNDVHRKSMLDEIHNLSPNAAIIRQTRSSKTSPSPSVSEADVSRISFRNNNCFNMSSESLKLCTSLEQKIRNEINCSHEVDIHAADGNADHQNSKNKLDCKTFLNEKCTITENKDAKAFLGGDVDNVGDGKVSPNVNEMKLTSTVNSSSGSIINDIYKLSHQQSSPIYSTIIMDDEKPYEDTLFSMQNSNKVIGDLQETSESHMEKSSNPIPNAEITIIDENVSNIVAGNKAEEEKASGSEKNLNKRNSPDETEKSNEKTADDVAYSDVKNDTSEKVQNLSRRKSTRNKTPCKFLEDNLGDVAYSEVKDDTSEKAKNLSRRKSGSKETSSKSFSDNLDDVAYSEVKGDTSQKVHNLSRRKSDRKKTPTKSFSDNLLDKSGLVLNILGQSLCNISQSTPNKTTKSPKLGLVSSTPKVNNIGDIKKSKNVLNTLKYHKNVPSQSSDEDTENELFDEEAIDDGDNYENIGDIPIPENVLNALKNNKNVQSQSSDDDTDGPEKELLDNEAMDAGDDYESGDSLATDVKEEMEQNEIKEKGETLNSDDVSDGSSNYEKDSFVVSSDEEDEALLSGTGDDLDSSDNKLNQSVKSKEKYNKRMSKERKQASREMYEARHGITNSKKLLRKSSSRKIESDSSESSDSEIFMKKSTNQSKMQLDSSCDISKLEAEKEISYAQLNNESVINDSHVKDPLSCTLPIKKRSFSNSINRSNENVENSSTGLNHGESKEGEIEQIELDENKSVYVNGDKSIDPLSNVACDDDADDDDDLSSLSSVDASVVDNYNSVLNGLNQSNKSQVKEESSDDENNDNTNPKSSLGKKTELTAPSSDKDEDEIEKPLLDAQIVKSSSVGIAAKNASDLSLHTYETDKSEIEKDSANGKNQDFIESTVTDPVKGKRKSKRMSTFENEFSAPDIDVHDFNDTSVTSNTKQDEEKKFNTTADSIEIKNRNKRLSNRSDMEVQNIINYANNVVEVSETNFNHEVLHKSNDKMKLESSMDGGKEELSKKSNNKLKNLSSNFNEVSDDSVVENKSIVENLNLSVSKKKEKKRNSVVRLTENVATIGSIDLAKLKETPQINSDRVINNTCLDKENENDIDNQTKNLGADKTEPEAEKDTKILVKKKNKKKELCNQSLNIIENSNNQSISGNASIIDNLNLTITKNKKKNSTQRKSQDENILNKSVKLISAIENIDSKADDSKGVTNNTKLKKANKKIKNKSLNNDDSADVSNASVVDNLNLKLPNKKTNTKKNSEHKNDSFYGETNKGKDRSILVSAQTIKMCDSDNDDTNVRLLFSSDEETESVSAKVEDILSCTAMRAGESSEEDEACYPLKKAEAKTNLLANGEGPIDNGVQIPESASCEKVTKKGKRNKNKKKKADQIETEVADVSKIEKEITEEPSISNDQRPEGKLSKKRRRKRKHLDSGTAEQNQEALKPQIQKASLKTKVHKEQVVDEPEPKAKKRKLQEEPMADHKETNIPTTRDEKSTAIRRLPQTFLDHLDRASKTISDAPQTTKLISTSEFKVDRANKRKAKPSEYLEQSILVGTEPTWTSNTGVIRTVKKPKLLPSIPTASTSGEGFTTQFKVVPLISATRRTGTRTDSEYTIRNFKTNALYGKKLKRITSEELVRKRSVVGLW